MPKSVLPKAESEQASARVTVEMRSVLREGRSPFMWATAANLRSSSASSQNGFPTADARRGRLWTKTTTLQKKTLRLLEARHRRAHGRRAEQDARARASK